MRTRYAVERWYLVLVGLFLGACASGSGSARGGYAQSFDSATSGCRQTPAYCQAAVGEETVVPVVTRAHAASVGASLAGAVKLFEGDHQKDVEKLLKDCVEQASAEVNLRWFGGPPTAAQCAEQVGVDARGNPIRRAMTLGTEKHRIALRCIQERLSELRPDGFSVEQRYRFDRKSNQTSLLSEEEAQALLRQGRGDQLRGTVRPDLVIHGGDPLKAQAVYDLKFPCPGSNEAKWNDYPQEHPHFPLNQGEVYKRALRVMPVRVAPGWGLVP
ncbi:hypothetical protein HPC49_48685 [Pyxidicoccus fallax]|uniref:Lipoprotein n=1 Tax=Pyxidicoccus fallax TaxID=394095 RepID=A0A848M029_9BACT|nr:hypothetical protein [Pyxidicoccus fallax]NMO23200.1 hypothetical protein [Pyxidicoccus fallax]NPC86050.1 hypothetical protein [Pyxidicoccus fallax]